MDKTCSRKHPLTTPLFYIPIRHKSRILLFISYVCRTGYDLNAICPHSLGSSTSQIVAPGGTGELICPSDGHRCNSVGGLGTDGGLLMDNQVDWLRSSTRTPPGFGGVNRALVQSQPMNLFRQFKPEQKPESDDP